MKNPFVQLGKAIANRGTKRSPHWPATRRHHLAVEGWCRQCGGVINLEVHHVVPFHVRPELELDYGNLITLCERIGHQCHLRAGHLGRWKCSNARIREQANHRQTILGPSSRARWRAETDQPL